MKNSFLGFLKRIPIKQRIIVAIAFALAIPAFILVRKFVICWSITDLPGMPPASCGVDNVLNGPIIATSQQKTQIEVPDEPISDVDAPEETLPSWDGGSRVTLLFIGLDERDWEAGQGAPRSDTMILFTIDPVSKTAGMLSVPRDLWINIPGYGYSRINTAYAWGEANKLPGGGPGMAIKTVEQVIGVPIQYYAQVDFKAFEEAIDAMGGLYLCPGERITIDPIGPKPPVKMGPNCQIYWGYEVLGYARNRKTKGGDIDRATRQQKVIMALINQVFSPAYFPTLVSKAPDIYAEAESGLRTNLGFDDALKLGVLLSQIPKENIKHGVIDYSMAALDKVGEASILKPFPDAIRVLRDEIFSAAGPLSPVASGDPVILMQEDAAQVRVLNGTDTNDLADRTANFLLTQGMQVVETGRADRSYARTTIVVYGPKLYTLRYLIALFELEDGYTYQSIMLDPDHNSPVDIEVRVGADALSLIP